MAIPDYQGIMLPLLRFFRDGKEHPYSEAVEALSSFFKLTEEERRQMLPSGQQALFSNRVGWARTYLKQANLIEPTRRGFNQITIRGREVLGKKPQQINVDFLNQFEEFRDFRSRRRNRVAGALPNPDGDENTKTPEEILDVIYIQAKRWESTVGRPEIQRFVGALTGQKARKGVFITTSDFTDDAKDYASRIEMKVVLINGETLAQLMIGNSVGVSTAATYELKRIDSDYFSEV